MQFHLSRKRMRFVRIGLFFFSEEGLYFAPASSFEPVLIGEGVQVIHIEPMAWVYP